MNIKELKEYIKDLPDDMECVVEIHEFPEDIKYYPSIIAEQTEWKLVLYKIQTTYPI